MSGINAIFDGTCSIERDGSVASGKSGGARSFSAVATEEPCRIDKVSGVENERVDGAAIWGYVGYFRDDLDLRREDHVVKDGVTYLVEDVDALPGGVGNSHVEAALKRVHGG